VAPSSSVGRFLAGDSIACLLQHFTGKQGVVGGGSAGLDSDSGRGIGGSLRGLSSIVVEFGTRIADYHSGR
jgi:hypothetical protein